MRESVKESRMVRTFIPKDLGIRLGTRRAGLRSVSNSSTISPKLAFCC